MVKIAVPQWQDRVSPVFDTAGKAVLAEVLDGVAVGREEASVQGRRPIDRARFLSRRGVEVLVCCAISRPMELALLAVGIRVIANTCGTVEDVLHAFIEGRLDERAFAVPGTRSRRSVGRPGRAGGGRVDAACGSSAVRRRIVGQTPEP